MLAGLSLASYALLLPQTARQAPGQPFAPPDIFSQLLGAVCATSVGVAALCPSSALAADLQVAEFASPDLVQQSLNQAGMEGDLRMPPPGSSQ